MRNGTRILVAVLAVAAVLAVTAAPASHDHIGTVCHACAVAHGAALTSAWSSAGAPAAVVAVLSHGQPQRASAEFVSLKVPRAPPV